MERNIEEMPENVEDETNVTPVSTNTSKSKIEKSEEIEHVLPANNAKCSGDDLDDINKDKQTLNGNEIKYNQDQYNEKENRIDSKTYVDENHLSENTLHDDTERLEKKPSFETFESTKLTPNEGTYTDKTESCDMNIAVNENKTLQLEPSSGDLKEKSLVSIEKDPDNESDSGKLQRCEDDDEDIYVDMSHAQGKESIISIYGSTNDNIYTEVGDSQSDTTKSKIPKGPPPVPTAPRPKSILSGTEDHIYYEISDDGMNPSSEDVPPDLPKTPRPAKINTFSDSTDGILQPLHIIGPSQPRNIYTDIASDRLRKIILDEVPNDISIKEIHVNIERELLSKGDDFEDITLNRTLKEAVVTLKSSTAANELLKRARSGKHFILKEKHVSIAHYEQTSLDPTKILLLGLNEESTTQFVSSQIKSICGVQPLSVIKGVDPTIAMLVFDSNTDLTEFQCKLKANETKWLPFPVERTRRVRVQGVPIETTPNALEHYLKQFSKDGSVHHIKYIKYRDVWNDYIISFTKVEDADALVRAAPHKLNEAELEVSLYYPYLAGDEEYFLNTPAPFKIDDLNIYICRFLQESQQPKKDVEEIVESHHGKIIWPDPGMERKLYIQCNIDENDKTAIAKVKDWKENITGVVAQICKMFSVQVQYFALEIKSQLRSRIESVGSTNPDSFFIKIEENRVVIAGYQNDAEKWDTRVENMITSIEQEHDSQGKYLTKTMKLKPFEFELLDASNSFEKLKNVERTLKNKTLVLKGRKQMVDSAVIKVLRMIRDFPKNDIKGLSPMVLALLHTSKTNHYVKQIFMKSEVTGCWHFVGQGTLELYSLTCNGLITVERCIRSCFRSTSLEIERELRDHLQQEKFLAKLETEYKEKVQFDCSTNRLLILSWDCLHDEIVEKVKKFLDLHTTVSEDFHLDPGEFRYLFSYKKTSIRKILQHYEDMNVEIDVLDKLTRKGFAVKGERKSCKTAIAHLRDFVAETITRDEHIVNSHELSKYFGTSEGINKLKTFELSEKCVIRISTPESQVVPTNVCLSECRIGGSEIQILKGDITEAEVDFIVIPNESTFDHKYGLARTIIDKGGFSIQRECQQYISEAKCVNDGDTFITSSGHLPCREIIHVVLPVWTKENSEKESIISNAVTKCLLEGENRKATSIAFPPLGAGRYRYPSDVIVEQMIKSIKEYLMENGADTCLRHIYMHDVEKESSLLFVKAMKNEIPQSTILIPEMLTESRAEANESYGYNIYPEIVTGSLVSQDVDVIVNSTNSELNLRIGRLSKAIVKDGGDEIESKLEELYPNGILPGEIAESKAGNLKCKAIYHGLLVDWDNGQGHAEMVLNCFVQSCLSSAMKKRYKSIAFPVLATGTHSFPPERVAKIMVKAIEEFGEENPVHTFETVRIVIQPEDEQALKAFEEYKTPYDRKAMVSQLSMIHSRQRCIRESVFIKSTGPYFTTKIGHVTVCIQQGDITKADTAVIVNSVSSDLNLDSGEISKSILRAAGRTIQFQAYGLLETFKKEDLVTTSSGSLICQKIIHVRARNGLEGWKRTFAKSLAEVERLKLSSVSFPAMGTGGKGFPVSEMARTMISAFQKYIRGDSYQGCLKSIKIVVYNAEMEDIFTKEAKSALKAAKRMSFLSKFWETKSTDQTDLSRMVFHIYTDTADSAINVKKRIDNLCEEISQS